MIKAEGSNESQEHTCNQYSEAAADAELSWKVYVRGAC